MIGERYPKTYAYPEVLLHSSQHLEATKPENSKAGKANQTIVTRPAPHKWVNKYL